MIPRILIINPNSDEKATELIDRSAKNFAGNSMLIKSITIATGATLVSCNYDYFLSAKEMVEIVTKEQDNFDTFIVACHADPNLDLLKECSSKPVVGIAEASMKIASMLGHKFSVLSPGTRGIPNKELLIRKYGLERQLASIRPIENNSSTLIDSLIVTGKKAVTEDNAEIIVLGCAEFSGFEKIIENELGVPVIDGVIAALILASGFALAGISTSKVRRYKKGM